MNISRIKDCVYQLLDTLPASLYYHNKRHTESMVATALQLCKEEGVSAEETELVETAALLHDVGFTVSIDGENHEEESCRIAQRLLTEEDCTNEQKTIVYQLILATKTPQLPKTHLEKIMCDADLFYLGTDEYEATSHLLYKELKAQHKIDSEAHWLDIQIQFLSVHHYFTKTAKKQLETKKKANLEAIVNEQKRKL